MYYYFSLLHVHIQYDVATSRGYKIMRIIAVGFEKEPFFPFSKGRLCHCEGCGFLAV